jgi:hypothetical protein
LPVDRSAGGRDVGLVEEPGSRISQGSRYIGGGPLPQSAAKFRIRKTVNAEGEYEQSRLGSLDWLDVKYIDVMAL